FGCGWAGAVAPVTRLVGRAVVNFLVGQGFVPRLHDCSTVLLSFRFHRPLQAFEQDHAHAPGAAVCKFRTRERRILPGHTLSGGLMTRLTIRSEYLFAAIARR